MTSRAVRLILALAFGILLASLAADAQSPTKIPRIGVLVPAEPQSPEEPNIAAFRHALQDLGYVEGQSIAVEYRYAYGEPERFRDLTTELVELRVDSMVVGSGDGARAAKRATSTIPIVMAGVGDPVSQGLVASLSRPGGMSRACRWTSAKGSVASGWSCLRRPLRCYPTSRSCTTIQPIQASHGS